MDAVNELLRSKGGAPICPKCKKKAIKLISLTDDGKGDRMCKKCKVAYKKKHPDKNYSKVV